MARCHFRPTERGDAVATAAGRWATCTAAESISTVSPACASSPLRMPNHHQPNSSSRPSARARSDTSSRCSSSSRPRRHSATQSSTRDRDLRPARPRGPDAPPGANVRRAFQHPLDVVGCQFVVGIECRTYSVVPARARRCGPAQASRRGRGSPAPGWPPRGSRGRGRGWPSSHRRTCRRLPWLDLVPPHRSPGRVDAAAGPHPRLALVVDVIHGRLADERVKALDDRVHRVGERPRARATSLNSRSTYSWGTARRAGPGCRRQSATPRTSATKGCVAFSPLIVRALQRSFVETTPTSSPIRAFARSSHSG